jgi:hypothetical protein
MEAFRDSEDELTDAQIEEMIQHKFKTEQEILDLQKKYHKEFTQVLSMKQVGKLYVTEERFKQMLLKEMRGHRDGQGQREPGKRGGPNGPDRR